MSRNTPKEWALAIGGGLAFAVVLVAVLRPDSGGAPAEPQMAPTAATPAPTATPLPPPAGQPPAAAVSTLPQNLVLAGLRAGPDGGMAIVIAGGRQLLLRPGQTLPDGTRLVRVEQTRALLSGPAGDMVLTFPEGRQAAVPAAAAPAEPASWLPALTPVQGDSGITGWRITTPFPPLAKAGLQPGDIIIAIDDNPLPSQRKIEEITQDLAAAGLVQVRYRRGNQLLQATVSP